MRVAFFWIGFDGRYGRWQDGLFAAMKLLEQDHEVRYFDVNEGTLQECREWRPNAILFWEAPCTINGKDKDMYLGVANLPFKKALLFAGGPLNAPDVQGFDLLFVESDINADDCKRQGIPYKKAFGTNTQVFRPVKCPKAYGGFMHATFANWKRFELFAEALQSKGAVAGRLQAHDRYGYEACKKYGVEVHAELPAQDVAGMINQSHAVVNTSDFWGGGQRCTVEAMACGVPVIAMSDSPKNMEFVQKSGGGIVCDPNPLSIRSAVEKCKQPNDMGDKAFTYIQSNLTERHYADALLQGLETFV